MPVIISQFSSTEFDSTKARELAVLTQQAYQQLSDYKTKTSWTLNSPYKVLSTFKYDKNPFGFVASKTDENGQVCIYIVFRGTIRLAEWFKDANIPLVSYKDGKAQGGNVILEVKDILGSIAAVFNQSNNSNIIIESDEYGCTTLGFRQIYIDLRDAIISTLNNNGFDNNCKVFVAGHSLGAALATLAIPDILENIEFVTHSNIFLYTFASPRCGDRIFADKLQKSGVKHWRIANTEDLVTMIPFPTGNVFQVPETDTDPPELDRLVLPTQEVDDLGIGGVTGVDKNPNPIFGFFKAMYDRNKRRMPDYVHTGTPIYFTIHDAALERHHNLNETYMLGISEDPIPDLH
jgi:Lipase (class 3)